MAKASISIGVDDATGQPASAPEGPYITDEDDGSRARRSRFRHSKPRGGTGGRGRRDSEPDEDLAGQRKGPAQP